MELSRPVYIGDTIRGQATATSVHPLRHMAELTFVVCNQDGETVLEGEATLHQAQPLAE
jgi:acyl dehydratase